MMANNCCGAGLYREKEKMIMRSSPRHPRRDQQVEGATWDAAQKVGLLSDALNLRYLE